MKDTDGEPPTPPVTGALSEDGMRSIIAGTADEIVPFALSLIVEGETPNAARKRLLKLSREWMKAKTKTAAEFRAAVYRVTVVGVALLALDERVRGEEVISREMTALGEKGIR